MDWEEQMEREARKLEEKKANKKADPRMAAELNEFLIEEDPEKPAGKAAAALGTVLLVLACAAAILAFGQTMALYENLAVRFGLVVISFILLVCGALLNKGQDVLKLLTALFLVLAGLSAFI